MNNTLSLEQILRTRNLDAYLILRQHKPDSKAGFMEIGFINPRMKQKEIAKELGYPSSTLQTHKK